MADRVVPRRAAESPDTDSDGVGRRRFPMIIVSVNKKKKTKKKSVYRKREIRRLLLYAYDYYRAY